MRAIYLLAKEVQQLKYQANPLLALIENDSKHK